MTDIDHVAYSSGISSLNKASRLANSDAFAYISKMRVDNGYGMKWEMLWYDSFLTIYEVISSIFMRIVQCFGLINSWIGLKYNAKFAQYVNGLRKIAIFDEPTFTYEYYINFSFTKTYYMCVNGDYSWHVMDSPAITMRTIPNEVKFVSNCCKWKVFLCWFRPFSHICFVDAAIKPNSSIRCITMS